MGAITEIRFMSRSAKCNIQKISKDSYVELSTGELKSFTHTETREESKNSVAQSLSRLRELLNTNVQNPTHVIWLTVTYRTRMSDTDQLYDDFRKFNMRLKNYVNRNGFPNYEYIVAMEPQQRGAWHAHALLIFPCKAPFIPNSEIQNLWGLGYTKTKALKNVENVGLYLSSYLSSMELSEAMQQGMIKGDLKEVTIEDETGQTTKKVIVKGARLKFYPTKFRLFRTSRGIKKPIVSECTEAEAMTEVGNAPLTFERTIKVTGDDGQGFNIINFRQYNKARKKQQEGATKR